MQALILAAGRGSRLGPLGAGPKCLLEIGRRPIVEHQLETLARCGIGPACLVVGYGADEVRERVGIRAEYVTNPRWSATNSLYSYWLARDWVTDDVIVLNCDVLFAPQLVERLLDVPGDALAYDSSSGERREEMSVRLQDGMLVDMSKSLPPSEVSGENVGMLKLTRDTARALFEKAGELVAAGHEKDWLGAAVRQIAQTRPIRGVDVAGLPWAEIDFPADLDRARKVTWPAIERAARRGRRSFRILRGAALAAAGIALAVASYSAWLAPNEVTWETVAPSGPERVLITNGARHRPCWLLAESQSASIEAEGPGTLRIYARPVFDTSAATAHYALKISVDGGPAELHPLQGVPSGTWKLGDKAVGKSERLEIDVAAGHHVVAVTLAASDSGRCLLRFAQLDPDA